MLSQAVRRLLRLKDLSQSSKENQCVRKYTKRLLKQQEDFPKEVHSLITMCQDVAMDRDDNINAIETARGKRIFDKHCEFQTSIIESMGKDEFDRYTHQAKQEIFGTKNVKHIDLEKQEKRLKSQCLLTEFEGWCDI
jgi:hypothetical protein